MGGDRRRTTSHSIEVPFSLTPQNNSRKRPQPYTHDCFSGQCGDKEEMEECHAAMILMKLSHSPKNAEKWFGSSPGSSSSSGSSWSSGSSSPPLSDDGHAGLNTSVILNDASARIRTTSVSTSDEGIVVDFKEEAPRKKRVSKWLRCQQFINAILCSNLRAAAASNGDCVKNFIVGCRLPSVDLLNSVFD
ncbi:uncharacterized protein LOC128865346 isoform X1 [Anastrepha ludens]|uniref:uncharacterized protein LOC128865346 isoform X1 n=1 Tax=Anastrepha ludens TaxID=28586 RepID=UPI0023B0787A|nr:uncharacterized protein LOC128865346 isoform X1 [Anastrepha ludens]XP_053961563.1 uncharacterized protein LOC128865346 isoform X1 [Anastrepha ludens]XP_053961571.1 uncharacterized protein LOC128865346 isoform X1 [Anastrepha ludens]XP_053961580.1 uncharacterized protein LOC128865346 isoform X1 [Anastrepha ludens]XP_053961589.1 uncharacterized protein LOC128865346 isoform X1 [Anastrepha ludens]XP_053961599.1 uncharacterized protein LOC128865346 isoform X1 [Anastrepha ludens]XP_053961610.1 un